MEHYLKTSNVARVPQYTIPRQRKIPPFAVKKEHLNPEIGPGSYAAPKRLTNSSVVISPSKYNRSTIDVRRARKETALGPGRY
mmetsp:Transcript_22114/g.29556  ORF Transcript_22114/g.29556 Transcript_22114/m.29556 type:complete len:83 (-) Transcript_22114:159-407(-)